jgi:hypothetical protein
MTQTNQVFANKDGTQGGIIIIAQFLLVLEVRDRLYVSKPEKQTLCVARFNLKKLNVA